MQNYVTVKNRRAFFVCSVAALVVGVASIAYSALIGSSGANPSSISYIQTSQQDAWTTMALAAAGADTGDPAHLATVTGSQATDIERTILAITATGNDPRTFSADNLVARLIRDFYSDHQIGVATQINDDVFGVLALMSAGVRTDNPVVADARSFILSHQNPDGGWSWAVASPSDTNDSAMAVMALLASGLPPSHDAITRAVSYIHATQNPDGGFPYEAGGNSDGASTAWIISMLNGLGISPDSWDSSSDADTDTANADPLSYVETLRTPNGSYKWIPTDASGSLFVTNYAVIAVSGASYPVHSLSATDPVVTFRIEGDTAQICSGTITANTAIAVIPQASTRCGYTYVITDTSFGPYVSAVNNDVAAGLVGWMYLVNNVSPSIGAADYLMQEGDDVIWFFGAFGSEPRPPVSHEGDASTAIRIGLSVHVTAPTQNPGGPGNNNTGSAIAFTVDKTTLDFGSVPAGNSATSSVSISNTGASALSFDAEVTGHSVFTNNLTLAQHPWQQWALSLNSGSQQAVEAGITIPAGTPPGQKSGQLVVWARGQ